MEVRQRGSHKIFNRSGLSRPIVVPIHNMDIPVFVIRNILRVLGLTHEQYLEILRHT